jgi:DNA-binding NtrC family response regulator
VAHRYPLLWIDLKVSRQRQDPDDEIFEQHFDVHLHDSVSTIDMSIEQVKPRVLCFDYDYPTKPGLKELQRTKQAYSGIPILMLTVQHSESLAVWAFRSRVWDYFVKPIATLELDYCLTGLLEMLEMQSLQPQGRELAKVTSLIP